MEPKSKSGKSKGKLKKNKGKGSITPAVDTTVAEEKPDPSVMHCGNRKEICHVEYSLLPKEAFPVYHVDIVCWGDVTKIFTKEDVYCIKSYVHQDITWVSFSVLHKLGSVSDRVLNDLLQFEVNFKFSQLLTELMPHVKNDTPKEFYNKPDECIDDTASETIFKTVSQVEPPMKDSYKDIQMKEDHYYASYPERGTIFSLLLGLPCELHKKSIIEKITSFKSILQSTVTERISSPKSISTKGKGRKGKTSTTKKEKVSAAVGKNKSTLCIKGELLFKEGRILLNETTEPLSSSIPYTCVFTTVNNLLSSNQRQRLNPFILDIKHLFNLPQDFVDKYRIHQIYCEFVFNNLITETQTPKIEVNNVKQIDINHSHILFMTPLSDDTLSVFEITNAFLKFEAIQTGRLIIKVYGVTSIPIEDDVVPCVFGQRLTDPYISSRHHELFNKQVKHNNSPKDGSILLGTAVFNLFPISAGVIHHADFVTLTALPVFIVDPAPETVNKVNCISLHNDDNQYDQTPVGVIPNAILLEQSTTLEIEITLFKPLMQLALQHTLLLPSTVYSRCIVILKNIRVAAKIVQKIQAINAEVLRCWTSFFPLILSDAEKLRDYELWKSQTDDEMSLMDSENRKLSLQSNATSFGGSEDWRLSVKARRRNNYLITGFFIDNYGEGILMIEGLTNLTFPRVYAHIYTLRTEYGHVIYNSDALFSRRLYSDFYSLGGLYIVTLGIPMDSLLNKARVYLEGYVPTPAQKALLMLDLLRKTSTIHDACIMQLFPSSQQLLSLGIEFGVPLYST